ncbi:MAG TPA: glycosyltransferase [Thermoanaerobaculia bacterium]|nr:glycosyltransferase [Thermoanaerobaculia bacterium]
MRILHVVPTYLPATRYGGPIYAVHGLCRALVARGHEVDVFTTNVDGEGDSDVPLGVRVNLDGVGVHYFASPSAGFFAHLQRRVYASRTLRTALAGHLATYDVLHLHSVFLLPTYVAARIAERVHVPYIVSPRGMLVPDLIHRKSRLVKNVWIRLVERRTFLHSSAIHFTAQREWDEARRIPIPLPDPFIVPNGIDLPSDTSTPRLANTLLFLGRINWKKGLDRLLDAVKAVPNVKVVIAGNDEEELTPKLRAQAERNGISSRVAFRGPVSGVAKEELLRTATALVLPSLSENFGNVILEALAVRMPVIVTPEVGLASDVALAGAGLVTSGLPEPLSVAINTLMSDSEARAVMGRRGRALVEARFTWDRVATQMEKHYLRIVTAARVAPVK